MFKNLLNTYKRYRALILSIVGLVAILLPVALIVHYSVDIATKLKAYPYIGADVAYKNTISVQGEGKVYAKPDVAIADLSVITEGTDIGELQEKNSKKMNKVINLLKDSGIKEKDIKTTNYQIRPRYSYQERKIPQIIGYEINQTLEVKIRDMSKIGQIFEKSVDIGINQISSLRFKIDDEERLKAEARELAIKNAKEKAKKLASELGVKLIKVSGFTEEAGPGYSPYREFGVGGGEVPQVEVGENEIVVNVTLIYEID